MSRSMTAEEARYISRAPNAAESARRLEQIQRHAAEPGVPAAPLPPVSFNGGHTIGGWALYRAPPSGYDREVARRFPTHPAPSAAPVLVQLTAHSERSLSFRTRVSERLPESWSGHSWPDGKPRVFMRLFELERIDETHPLVVAELARRKAAELLAFKRDSAERIFDENAQLRAALRKILFCASCKGAGTRERNIDGADVEVACGCSGGIEPGFESFVDEVKLARGGGL